MSGLIATELSYAWHLRREVVPALRDFGATFECGVPHLICGPSGSGKTTLSLLLAGLLKPDSGSVSLDGTPVSERRSETAYVFQFPENIFFEDSVRIEFAQVVGPSRNGTAVSYLERIGIPFPQIADTHPFHLSEGYGRLVATVLQVAREPQVLVLDEPTIGLDWHFHERMIDLVRQCVQPDRILIIVTHDVDFMRDIGGRARVLVEGRLAWSGETSDLLAQPPLLRQFGLKA
ncbi:energy-coupling factor ABC transporter ATP-binding protein [bacterium]|nr:energy-coupling factor ABC transporter ATP-binding protein [bacterium]MBU1983192.1 energy-coupling factor ABC transporter ATP-binding protein [bacterium]